MVPMGRRRITRHVVWESSQRRTQPVCACGGSIEMGDVLNLGAPRRITKVRRTNQFDGIPEGLVYDAIRLICICQDIGPEHPRIHDI